MGDPDKSWEGKKAGGGGGGKATGPVVVPKSVAQLQRMKLEKLMKNPDKPVNIPEGPRSWAPKAPPEFVRDVMGSSAGAGSGEFHVYRHIRRREYVRQEYHERQSAKSKLDEEYEKKLEENKRKGDQRTAKKRLKRWKLKQKKAAKKPKPGDKAAGAADEQKESSSSSSSGAESGEDDAEEPSFVMGAR